MIRSTKSRTLLMAIGLATAGTLLLPVESWAQRRAVRRPAVRSVVHVAARPYRPVVYPPFYFYGGYSAWYGWPGWYPYYHLPPYPYRFSYRDYASSARIQVQPRHAEVFIDGYFAGLVDDFDGWAQRLRVEPGERELQIFLDGYRTFRQNVLFRPGATIRIEHVMQPLAPGEQPEPRPAPSPTAAAPPPVRRGPPVPAVERRVPPARSAGARDYGAIAIRVQPADAQVFVNGEHWDSPDSGGLTLELAEGTHRIEIRREGYRPYAAEIRVVGGETTSLNVSLSRP